MAYRTLKCCDNKKVDEFSFELSLSRESQYKIGEEFGLNSNMQVKFANANIEKAWTNLGRLNFTKLDTSDPENNNSDNRDEYDRLPVALGIVDSTPHYLHVPILYVKLTKKMTIRKLREKLSEVKLLDNVVNKDLGTSFRVLLDDLKKSNKGTDLSTLQKKGDVYFMEVIDKPSLSLIINLRERLEKGLRTLTKEQRINKTFKPFIKALIDPGVPHVALCGQLEKHLISKQISYKEKCLRNNVLQKSLDIRFSKLAITPRFGPQVKHTLGCLGFSPIKPEIGTEEGGHSDNNGCYKRSPTMELLQSNKEEPLNYEDDETFHILSETNPWKKKLAPTESDAESIFKYPKKSNSRIINGTKRTSSSSGEEEYEEGSSEGSSEYEEESELSSSILSRRGTFH